MFCDSATFRIWFLKALHYFALNLAEEGRRSIKDPFGEVLKRTVPEAATSLCTHPIGSGLGPLFMPDHNGGLGDDVCAQEKEESGLVNNQWSLSYYV